MKPKHDSEFDALLSRVTEGVASGEELRCLERLLAGDADRQHAYFDWISTHLLLEKEGAMRAEVERTRLDPAAAITTPESAPKSTTRPRGEAGRGGPPRRGVWFAVAAAFLLVVGGVVVREASRSEDVAIATVIDTIEVVGSPYELTAEGAVLDRGLPLRFESGAVSVRMPSGAQFTVEGPASLTVTGENGVELTVGRLFARVPPAGVGFTVETPSGSLVDLGTEFGVIVDQLGATQSYVYEGQVRAEAGETTANLTAGTAVQIDREGRLSRPTGFNESEVGFTRSIDGTGYVSAIGQLQPLYLHRFSPNSNQRRFWSTIGQQQRSVSLRGGVYAAAGGPIVQPQSSDGCLRFVGVESTTEVGSIQGALKESGAYTVLLWCRVDEEGPQGLAVLANALGPDAGLAVGLRTTADGRIEHRCYDTSRRAVLQLSEASLPMGVWTQVVAAGRTSGELRLFINGEAAAAPAAVQAAIRTDCGRLLLGSGAGRRLEDHEDTGPLRGAIDEVAFFDRCLTPKEVRRLYQEASTSIPRHLL